jgi:DNA modification methylase
VAKKIIKIKCEGTQYVDFHKLNEFQEDIKTITREDLNNLKESIITRGYIKPGFIWKHNKKLWILDMHQRLKALTELEKEGWYIPLIPIVEIFAKTVKEAKDAVLVFTSQSGKIDENKLKIYIQKYQIKIKTLVIRNEPIKLDIGIPKETKGDDEIPEEVQPITKLGDLWELGRHEILCGDSTEKGDVKRLMDGEKADMVFTDPPYGVNVKGGENKTNIAGDLTQTAIPFSFEICILFTKDDARFYFCGGEGNLGLYAKLFERFLSQIPRHLIWVKEGFVMKQNGYHNQYELIFYGFKPGGGGRKKWFAGRTMSEASDVVNIKRDASNKYMHPTQKPVALPERFIRNSSQEKDLIFDLFLGSGSTLIACEKTNRICYGMEIEPYYCDVIVKRYIDWCQKNNRPILVKRNGKLVDINKFNLPAKQGVSRE